MRVDARGNSATATITKTSAATVAGKRRSGRAQKLARCGGDNVPGDVCNPCPGQWGDLRIGGRRACRCHRVRGSAVRTRRRPRIPATATATAATAATAGVFDERTSAAAPSTTTAAAPSAGVHPACAERQRLRGRRAPNQRCWMHLMDRPTFDRLFDMTDRTVIVTGGTRGIGLALAEGYVLAGARVVVASRKADAYEQDAQHLRELGGQAIGVPTHLGEVDDLGVLVERTVAEFGGVDVVVNNAANPLAMPLGDITVDALTKSFEVNLRGPVMLVQEALPHLKSSEHAAILNMVSIGAFIFAPVLSIYASMKAAMMSFTRSMAAEFVHHGIRVNALAPGPVDTDMMRKNPKEAIDGMVGGTLLGRLASADEMVGAALLLTSDAGSYMTGQVIMVDGGGTPR